MKHSFFLYVASQTLATNNKKRCFKYFDPRIYNIKFVKKFFEIYYKKKELAIIMSELDFFFGYM